MMPDNRPGVASYIKREGVDPSQTIDANCAGDYIHDIAQDDSNMPVPSLEPRPFPPPSLVGVPMEYVVDQLRNLASYYWKRPETADCTIVIPVPHLRGGLVPPSLSGIFPLQTESFTAMLDPSGRSRRATQPASNFVPQISFKLHVDYLSAHSSYLRGLFSGTSALDLVQSTSATPPSRFKIPANRMPRLLPSPPNHPVLFLPVPDPTSFHLLIHWIYFGETGLIDDCLHQGVIQWEGIARNVEYLGLSPEIKMFLRTWYSRWLDREQSRCGSDSDSDDADTLYSDMDDDSSTLEESEVESDDSEKEIWRGRSRVARPLSSLNPKTNVS